MNKIVHNMQSNAVRKPGTVPYNPNTSLPNLCKNCRYFISPRYHESIKYGECTRFGELNLVDGSVEYDMACVARDVKCKGEHFTLNTLSSAHSYATNFERN
jgi:hypothetical protein